MRNPEQVLNILAEHSNESGYKYERLYRILFNEQMFLVAYQRIHAKPGNMTPGTDGQTEDGMSIDKIHALIDSLKSEVYRPKPAKRVYIPKKSGKLRPLGIPTFADKLVQEVVRMKPYTKDILNGLHMVSDHTKAATRHLRVYRIISTEQSGSLRET